MVKIDESYEYITQVNGLHEVYCADTGLFVTENEPKAQIAANRQAIFKRVADIVAKYGQKTFIITSSEAEKLCGGDVKSAFRKRLSTVNHVADTVNYYEMKSVIEEHEDVRSVTVCGGCSVINAAKRLCNEYDKPLFVIFTRPDSDDVLSPYYIVYEGGRAIVKECRAPELVLFDIGYALETEDIYCGVGQIAKILVTLFEMDYLGKATDTTDLTDIIRRCMFVDFTQNTAENRRLLYTSLLELSALKNNGNDLLMTGVDGLIQTVDALGYRGNDYAYACSKLITKVYENALSEEGLRINLPPSPVKQYDRLRRLRLDTTLFGGKGDDVAFPDMNEKILRLSRSIELFDFAEMPKGLPMNKSRLSDILCASVTVQRRKGLLSDLYFNGFIGA